MLLVFLCFEFNNIHKAIKCVTIFASAGTVINIHITEDILSNHCKMCHNSMHRCWISTCLPSQIKFYFVVI